jgi:hypothetical protein
MNVALLKMEKPVLPQADRAGQATPQSPPSRGGLTGAAYSCSANN